MIGTMKNMKRDGKETDMDCSMKLTNSSNINSIDMLMVPMEEHKDGNVKKIKLAVWRKPHNIVQVIDVAPVGEELIYYSYLFLLGKQTFPSPKL